MIDERDFILNKLEIAETRYISSFRISTPEPSLLSNPPVPRQAPPPEDGDDLKRQISRPQALAGYRVSNVFLDPLEGTALNRLFCSIVIALAANELKSKIRLLPYLVHQRHTLHPNNTINYELSVG